MRSQKVITKHQLRSVHFDEGSVEEVCGPASVAMLLDAAGHDFSMQEVVRRMRYNQAFIPEVGTVLSRTPRCFSLRLFYVPYVPLWLLRLLLLTGYACAHSVKRSSGLGNHIIFVESYRQGVVHAYDPNLNSTESTLISAKEWRLYSNHRAVFLKKSRKE